MERYLALNTKSRYKDAGTSDKVKGQICQLAAFSLF
jgi:hypothetical protein